jgi:hypothetical protein
MPLSFGRLKVVPLLGAFQAEYPDLKKWRATVDEDGHYCFAVPL